VPLATRNYGYDVDHVPWSIVKETEIASLDYTVMAVSNFVFLQRIIQLIVSRDPQTNGNGVTLFDVLFGQSQSSFGLMSS
jgi:hypothetical protein